MRSAITFWLTKIYGRLKGNAHYQLDLMSISVALSQLRLSAVFT